LTQCYSVKELHTVAKKVNTTSESSQNSNGWKTHVVLLQVVVGKKIENWWKLSETRPKRFEWRTVVTVARQQYYNIYYAVRPAYVRFAKGKYRYASATDKLSRQKYMYRQYFAVKFGNDRVLPRLYDRIPRVGH
jgi:hypothetical protein